MHFEHFASLELECLWFAIKWCDRTENKKNCSKPVVTVKHERFYTQKSRDGRKKKQTKQNKEHIKVKNTLLKQSRRSKK